MTAIIIMFWIFLGIQFDSSSDFENQIFFIFLLPKEHFTWINTSNVNYQTLHNYAVKKSISQML